MCSNYLMNKYASMRYNRNVAIVANRLLKQAADTDTIVVPSETASTQRRKINNPPLAGVTGALVAGGGAGLATMPEWYYAQKAYDAGVAKRLKRIAAVKEKFVYDPGGISGAFNGTGQRNFDVQKLLNTHTDRLANFKAVYGKARNLARNKAVLLTAGAAGLGGLGLYGAARGVQNIYDYVHKQ